MPSPSRVPFTDLAITIVAENKIRQAICEGEFERLPGLGRPHPVFDEPYDPYWWVRRKLRDEQIPAKPEPPVRP